MVITSTSGGELRRWFSAAERGFQLAPEVLVLGTTGSPGSVTEALLAGAGVEAAIGARVVSGVRAEVVICVRVVSEVGVGDCVGVSVVWLSLPQAGSTNMNTAGRRTDIVSLRLISALPQLHLIPYGTPSR